MLKRLKNIEDKTDNQLDLIKSQGNKQAIEKFYSGEDKKNTRIEKQSHKRNMSENMTDEDKVFSVKINKESFKIDRYTS